MTTKKKQIGEFLVTIEGAEISIIGNCGSNFGRVYEANLERFKAHPKGEEHDWNRPQIIGMEWEYGLLPAVKKWLYSQITA
jgi:hypothetical protein